LRGTTLLPPRVAAGRSLTSNKAVASNGAIRLLLSGSLRGAARGPVSMRSPPTGSHQPPVLCKRDRPHLFPSSPLWYIKVFYRRSRVLSRKNCAFPRKSGLEHNPVPLRGHSEPVRTLVWESVLRRGTGLGYFVMCWMRRSPASCGRSVQKPERLCGC
jgi:hypothetical protein